MSMVGGILAMESLIQAIQEWQKMNMAGGITLTEDLIHHIRAKQQMSMEAGIISMEELHKIIQECCLIKTSGSM